jgi:hypothetical protein
MRGWVAVVMYWFLFMVLFGVELIRVGFGYGVMGYGWVFVFELGGYEDDGEQYCGLAVEGIFKWILGLLSRIILV